MTDRPHPGTVAYRLPEPEPVNEVRPLASKGTTRTGAVASREVDRYTVGATHTYRVRRMHRLSLDDFAVTRVLLILQKVLQKKPPNLSFGT